MSSADWYASDDPAAMLAFLTGANAGLRDPLACVSDRKLRLFAAACCRQVWRLLPDARSRRAVEVAEAFADAEATAEELMRAWQGALAVDHSRMQATFAAARCAESPSELRQTPGIVLGLTQRCGVQTAAQAALLRDVVGSPWDEPVVFNGGAPEPALSIATRIYAERDFGALPVLADALEDHGYAAAHLLAHLRSEGPHCLGCWALDSVLGKS